LGDLNSACKQYFYSLLLRDLLPVLEEVLHAAVVGVLEEVLEALLDAELLVSVGEHPDVDHGEHVLVALRVGALHHHDEVLLSLGTQLQGDSLGQLLRNGVLNVP
jgi:hypothetical protein